MSKVKSKWHQKVLTDYYKQTLITVGVTTLILFVMAAIQLTKGHTFVWTNIAPLEQPAFFERAIYSALTFLTLGALLYYIRFYKALSSTFGRNRSGYRTTKSVIWVGLIFAMYMFIVPALVNVLNFLISLTYNVSLLLLYISPIVFLVLVMFIVTFICCVLLSRKFYDFG